MTPHPTPTHACQGSSISGIPLKQLSRLPAMMRKSMPGAPQCTTEEQASILFPGAKQPQSVRKEFTRTEWRTSMQNQIYPFCQTCRTSRRNSGVYGVLYWNSNFERDFDCNVSCFDWWKFATWCRPGRKRYFHRQPLKCGFGVHRILHWNCSHVQ